MSGRHGMRFSWLRRQFGGAPVSALALGLLVLGCVLVAMAGPRYSLHSRTRALQHDLAGLAPVDQAVQVTYDWNTFATQVSGYTPPVILGSQLSESRLQLARFLAAAPLPLAAGQWAGLSTDPLPALTSPALDLSVFTGSSAPVPIAPDLVALAVPAAGLAVLTAVAVVAETRLLRRRDVPGLLRIGG
jgi:hypothetical protein